MRCHLIAKRSIKTKAIPDPSLVSRLIPYSGGKVRLSKKLIKWFPEHTLYIEPFAGSLSVLFAKKPSHTEVVNDLDGDLVNFYRVVRQNSTEFRRMVHFTPYSRELYNELIETKDQYTTQVERAWYYYTMKRMAWMNDAKKDTIRVDTKGADPLLMHAIEKYAWVFADRLNSVYIEHRSFERIITQWDRPYAFFYCDPPYYGTEDVYNVEFTKMHHMKLAEMLNSISGKAMVSYYDEPWLNKLYKKWNKESFTIKSRGGKEDKAEVIYYNYELKKQLTIGGFI